VSGPPSQSVSGPPAAAPTSRLGWTALFGVAFGWVEAAVVVYLRRIYYPEGFAFPLRSIEPRLLVVELVREAATLVMLLAVACLCSRRAWIRFAHFLVAFGVWDLTYYAGLKIALGWPAGWADWDILFLLPMPWVAPVYAPAAIAAAMIVAGIVVARLGSAGRQVRSDRWTWAGGGAGAAVVLISFLHDPDAGLGRASPKPYPVLLLLLGLALFAAALGRLFAISRRGGRT
jgi:hypothetical protein